MAESATQLDATLAALADPTRRRVINLLRRRPRRAGELAQAFGVSAPAMSRHLRVLRQGGLIEEERVDVDARVRLYRLRRERFDELTAWLAKLGDSRADPPDAFLQPAESGNADAGR